MFCCLFSQALSQLLRSSPNYMMINPKPLPTLTRSASSSPAKPNTSSSPKPMSSIDDVFKAISDMRSTQNKLLIKQDSLGDELKLRLDALTFHFDAVSCKIIDLRNQVYRLDTRFIALESSPSSIRPSHTSSIFEII